ncbi:MAG TPA: Phenylacetic acid catabolic protein [Longimicrobiales bacterium]|nr:Phenylacetic acid catabolic protein [Longimicrobiales bacterium]
MMTATNVSEAAKAAALPDAVRAAVRDLILVLADSKRLLGTRYAEWILGAPELEAGIACASMSQDEWGHGRLLYALLRDFGDEVDRIEHGRDPAEYRSMGVLDAPPASWPELVALNALADLALTVQLEALRGSSYLPLRQRVQKLLEEEQFHAAHGAAWLRRLGRGGGPARDAAATAVRGLLSAVLQWFGPDSASARALLEAGIVDAAGSSLRARYLERAAALLGELDADDALTGVENDFSRFDEASRRVSGTAPDPATIARVRGDKNRAFLMD